MRVRLCGLACAACLGFALPAPAQAQQVTLRSINGELTVQGKLLSFEDGVYRIDSLMGELNVPASAVICVGPDCPSDPRNGIPGAPVRLSDKSGEMRLNGKLIAFDGATYRIDTTLGVLELPADGVTCTGPGCPVDVAAAPGPVPAPAPAAANAPQDAPAAAPPASDGGQGSSAAPGPELIQLARMTGEPVLRLAGPAPVLSALLPVLTGGFAAELGATAAPADVEFVSLARAREEGMPAGSMGLTLSGGDGGPATVLGRFTSGPEQALRLIEAGAADMVVSTAQASLADPRLADGMALGSDGMVAIVAPENPLTEIPTRSLARIFAGEITDWSELGAPAGPIRLVGLPESHAGAVSLAEMVLDPAGLAPRAADVVVPDVQTLASIVAGDPLALGFVNHAARGDARPLDLVTGCGLRATPGPDQFRTRRYPFTQAIVARQSADSPLAGRLLEYLRQDPRLLRDIGYADATIGLQSLEADRAALAGRLDGLPDNALRRAGENALAGMERARRLSQVLYFERGTNRLDPQSLDALGRILDWLDLNDTGEAFIVGHAPAGDTPDSALDAARAAADLVRQEITLSGAAPDDVIFRRLALGGLLPVVCADDIHYAATNSRVEIWVREN